MVPGANPGSSTATNQLTGVVALTTSNAWAVGSTTDGNSQALVEHWNGRTWTQAAIPAMGTASRLDGVAATSDRNIWAVGEFDSNGAAHTLAEQFDGNNWTVIPSPDGGQIKLNRRSTKAVDVHSGEVVSADQLWGSRTPHGQGTSRTRPKAWRLSR